jgi:hypothetical protein
MLPRAAPNLLNDLIGAAEQRERDSGAKGVGSLEIYYQLHFSGLLDRKIVRFLALENFSDVDAK